MKNKQYKTFYVYPVGCSSQKQEMVATDRASAINEIARISGVANWRDASKSGYWAVTMKR